MAHIFVRENETLEHALKRFGRKVDDEKILKEYRDRQYYVKPSKKRREKIKEARRKMEIKKIKNSRNRNFDRK